jgi:general secretion pathway protein N
MPSARHAIAVLLSAALLIVAAIIGLETDWGQTWRGSGMPTAATQPPALEAKVLPSFTLTPLATGYKETIERPLFVPTRRPAPAGNSGAMAMKKGQFRLAGTTVGTDTAVAYLVEIANNKTHRVNKGGDINGMRVEMVTANRVTLQQGEETEELSLRTAASPRPPPPQQLAAQSGAAAPAAMTGAGGPPLPGAPGGNFGPPLQPGQASAGYAPPGGAVANTGGPPLPSPASAGALIAQNFPLPPSQASNAMAGNPAPATPTAVEGQPDMNQPAQRRRRFQNLPQ